MVIPRQSKTGWIWFEGETEARVLLSEAQTSEKESEIERISKFFEQQTWQVEEKQHKAKKP